MSGATICKILTVEQIAEICHEANRAFCRALGDFTQPIWELVPNEIQKSAVDGVYFHLNHRGSEASDSHENWLRGKQRAGWKYGEAKDFKEKTHPCMVPFEKLPPEQQVKDHLFLSVVRSLEPYLWTGGSVESNEGKVGS